MAGQHVYKSVQDTLADKKADALNNEFVVAILDAVAVYDTKLVEWQRTSDERDAKIQSNFYSKSGQPAPPLPAKPRVEFTCWGRGDHSRENPWPSGINSRGREFVFADKAAAMAAYVPPLPPSLSSAELAKFQQVLHWQNLEHQWESDKKLNNYYPLTVDTVAIDNPMASSSAKPTFKKPVILNPDFKVDDSNVDSKYTSPDWRKSIARDQRDGFEMLVVPKGTTFYCGVSVRVDDCVVSPKHHFFGTLNTALWYAFSGEKHRGELGKVVVLQAARELVLFDVTRSQNWKVVSERFTVETQAEEENRHAKMTHLHVSDSDIYPGVSTKIPSYDMSTALEYCFQDGAFRVSNSQMDAIASVWMGKNLPCDGWGLETMPRYSSKGAPWHDEIFLTNPQLVLERTDVEFRAKGQTIIMTKSGEAVHTFHPDSQFCFPQLTGPTFQSIRRCATYEPKKDKLSDKFLLT